MSFRIAPLIVCALAFAAAPYFLPEFNLYQVCLIAGTALVVLGLVVVTGFAGQVSLAQAAFVALGGYGSAVLHSFWGLPLWIGIPLVSAIVGLLGFVLGLLTLRVSGHYLALVTMALTAIVQLGLIYSDPLTGGAAGMPMPSFEMFGFTLSEGRQLYFAIVPTTAFFFVIVHNLQNSRYGRTLAAIRQSPTAAQAMGIDVLQFKSLAFGASAFLGAFGGGILAVLSTYLDPAQFGIPQSVYFLTVAVVGGLMSPLGAIVGSVVFVFLPDFLQSFQTYLGLVFALLLLCFILLRPDGLISLWQSPRGLVRMIRTGGAN
ncbi:branched-chain amino acid ABC transporter permease [Ensifer adhaerens]|uniref:branched-chain amino acid ABC transporter permease n=1 Tax=Ensifer adhaerens TaxID=106592 RepID=UPI001CBA79E7|nr:branched-chain amino acid ABC transporter permease [Ensifer adhaerens]MBZ7924255.1 branched-chain amino acid ABC transporter permease [Ensifer adhaerens]UAX96492.1 branched-chain amino acid ABC transporter permease [Ensifer adhaerens]UAY04165.1 branched-chain amino acid ABC transporter permease [Ensifer adhaerens]UAY12151.1 branched-chain amino acid ABC transporter permease [Ensifer adhaerens]